MREAASFDRGLGHINSPAPLDGINMKAFDFQDQVIFFRKSIGSGRMIVLLRSFAMSWKAER